MENSIQQARLARREREQARDMSLCIALDVAKDRLT